MSTHHPPPPTNLTEPLLASPHTPIPYDLNATNLQRQLAELQAYSSTYFTTLKSNLPALHTQYTQQTDIIVQLTNLCITGRQYIQYVYQYRSLCRMFASHTSTQDTQHIDLAIYKLMLPYMRQLHVTYKYLQSCVKNVKLVTLFVIQGEKNNGVQNNTLIDTYINIISLLLRVDFIKHTKHSISNDVSYFINLCTTAVYSTLSQAEQTDTVRMNDDLTSFINNNNNNTAQYTLYNQLRTELNKFADIDTFYTVLLNRCADRLDGRVYNTTDEYYAMQMMLPFVLNMYDSDKINVFKNNIKQLNYSRIVQLIRTRPIVHVYCDIHMHTLEVLRTNKLFTVDVLQSFTGKPDALSEQCSLDNKIASIEQQFNKYILQLIAACDASNNAGQLYSVIVTGKALLLEWKIQCTDFLCYKYAYPNTTHAKATNAYDAALKYNLSTSDKAALIKLIMFVTNIVNHNNTARTSIVQRVSQHVYSCVQSFVSSSTLQSVYKRLKARKKPSDNAHLLDQVFVLVNTPSSGSTSYTYTQMTLLHWLLNYLVSERNTANKSGFFAEKDVNKAEAAEIDTFLVTLSEYQQMLQLDSVLTDVYDFSLLWYREYYIEKCGVVQFSINSSLVWVLIDYVLNGSDCQYIQYAVPLMCLYNHVLDYSGADGIEQYVLNEVEAELKLAFDQFVYFISELVYAQCENYIVYTNVDVYYEQLYDSKMQQLDQLITKKKKKKKKHIVQTNDFILIDNLVRLFNIYTLTLMDRRVNLNLILAQKCNAAMKNTLTNAIQKYQSQSLNVGLIELATTIRNVKLLHKFFVKHGLHVDEYEQLWNTVNGTTQLFVSCKNMILSHLITELFDQLFIYSHYNMYFNRFVTIQNAYLPPSTPLRLKYATKTADTTKYKTMQHKYNQLHANYFGAAHLQAIADLYTLHDVNVLMNEIYRYTETLLINELFQFYTQLIDVIEPIKLPKLMFGVSVAYISIEIKLKQFIAYKQLYSNILPCLATIGNIASFVQQLDTVFNASGKQSYYTAFVLKIADVAKQYIHVDTAQLTDMEASKTLSRFMNALQFVWCLPSKADIRALYGQSVQHATNILVYVSNQVELFDLIDPAYHIVKLNTIQPIVIEVIKGSKASDGPTPQQKQDQLCLQFVDTVKHVRSVNQYYTQLLSAHVDMHTIYPAMDDDVLTVPTYNEYAQSQAVPPNISRAPSLQTTPDRSLNGNGMPPQQQQHTLKPQNLHKLHIDTPATPSLKDDHFGLQLL